jgi:ABC-type transport system involved in multi-copper enzyme maturation permease subunit
LSRSIPLTRELNNPFFPMNSPQALYAVYWLVLDTFRQTLHSRVFWIMLALSSICIVFCLGVSIEGVGTFRNDWDLLTASGKPLQGANPEPGHMNLLFGAFRLTMHRDAVAEVRLLETIFATWVAGSIGVLLTLVWTAGFIPDFLQPSSAAVLLAKPVPRWLILAGKFAGVVLFVAMQAGIFFTGTWLTLGLRTGVWLNEYLLGVPLFVAYFASIYSFSILLAATFRSTLACVLGVVMFWVLCLALNFARYSVVSYHVLAPNGESLPAMTSLLVDFAYWTLPKPADMTLILEGMLHARMDQVTLSSLPQFHHAIELGEFHPALALVSSLAFCVATLALSAYQLAQTDY